MLDYYTYINSPEWWSVRQRKVKSSNFQCEVCSSNANLNVHHLTYVRLGSEKDSDLMVLCRGCHTMSHDLWKKMPKIPPAMVRTCLMHFLTYCNELNHQSGKANRRRKVNKAHNKLPQTVKILLSESKKAWRSSTANCSFSPPES